MIVQDKFSLQALENHFQESLKKEKNVFFKNLKQNSFEKFLRMGLPNNSLEEWIYFDLNLLFEFIFAAPKEPKPLNLIPDKNTIFLENGKFKADLSRVSEKIIFCSLSEAQEKHFDLFQKYFNENNKNFDAMALLNESFMSEGLFLYIPPNLFLTETLNIFCIANQANSSRLLIACDQNAQGKIFINTFGQGKYFASFVNEIILEEKASLEIYYLQNEDHNACQIANSYCYLEKNASLNWFNFSFGAHLSKHKIIANLNGSDAECFLNGLYVLSDENKTHNQVFLNHNEPNCLSSQLYKGILDDKAQAEFSGKIKVAPNAIQTDAKQLNRNLLISPQAKVDARPQLEIQADDVKCSHGATIGQLEEDQIFYLLSRGINFQQAKRILTYGFAEEIIQKITLNSLRQKLDELFLANIHNS